MPHQSGSIWEKSRLWKTTEHVQINWLFLHLLTMDSSFWTQYSPPCILRPAVNHRINHLRLLPLAPANPFCPGLHRRCSCCQPRVEQTLFIVLGGWEIRIRTQQGWFGQQAFTVLWFLLLTYLEKKNQLGFCKPLLPSPGYFYHIQHVQSWRERESLWLTDVGQNQNATQILTSTLHQGKRCSPKPGVAFIS